MNLSAKLLGRIVVSGFGLGVLLATAPVQALSPASEFCPGAPMRLYTVVSVVNGDGEDRRAEYDADFSSEVEVGASGDGEARWAYVGGWCSLSG